MVNSGDIIHTLTQPKFGFRSSDDGKSCYKDYIFAVDNGRQRITTIRASNHRTHLGTWLSGLNKNQLSKYQFISVVFEDTPTDGNEYINEPLKICVHEYVYDCKVLDIADVRNIIKVINNIRDKYKDPLELIPDKKAEYKEVKSKNNYNPQRQPIDDSKRHPRTFIVSERQVRMYIEQRVIEIMNNNNNN